MFILKTMGDLSVENIHVPQRVEERLRGTCFRGKTHRRAGNFSRWSSAQELFQHKEVLKHFLDEMREVWQDQDFGTHSVEIELGETVGWNSTAPARNFPQALLQKFKPNKRSSALRVKPRRKDVKAPRTNLVTIVYEFKSENGHPVAIVHSIYPGHDIGELEGDITQEEGRVFFDWNHPGV